MIEVRQTDRFKDWLEALRDNNARIRIAARIRRMESGNFGDVEPVGEGVSEMRIHYGPGYRVYFVRRGQEVVVLLCGGDKSGQDRDIAKAKDMAKEL
ncbi:MAG: type II toxin-antitoxin system RelE/ParE family toxin [Hyphomonas sp.]|nr:type II toxin-antitoxin system RelE/ParE family toxin [Hyphomonas sp.]MDP3460084.1 type II toxin-antitoxin system RelE/ParE family toxin [Hyphomonas sp.]